MTEFEKLLNMIKNVDPADGAALDEIDVLVFKYLGDKWGNLWVTMANESIVYSIAKYTRSRDALKAIRPAGWGYSVQTSVNYKFSIYAKAFKFDPPLTKKQCEDKSYKITQHKVIHFESSGKTEELA